MIAKLKEEAMRRGMKLMSNPTFMKVMSDPRVMKAIGEGFALKGRVQSELEGRMRDMATALNLATKEDVKELRRSLEAMEATVTSMEKKMDPNQPF
jgi:polyhydroxyalkanoate synthesis regulator phasin